VDGATARQWRTPADRIARVEAYVQGLPTRDRAEPARVVVDNRPAGPEAGGR
jgi:hypothetical protein